MATTFTSIGSIFTLFILSLLASPFLTQIELILFLLALVINYAFFKSIITGNYSQVDELWTIVPIFFVYHFNHWSPRGILMFILASIWGLRLSYNFWRKGGYRGLEDYRWEQLRQIIKNKCLWFLFNVIFISTYQSILLMLICSPVYFEDQSPLKVRDAVLGILYLGFVFLETVADWQQWKFQSEKKALIEKGQKSKGNFVTNGLFRYSRHPNFFAEQCIWWIFYAFTDSWNISIAGPILLTLLFQGSTTFTEYLSKKKYPEYAEYQKTTSRLIPWFPGKAKNL